MNQPQSPQDEFPKKKLNNDEPSRVETGGKNSNHNVRPANSLSRQPMSPQPAGGPHDNGPAPEISAHVVLYQPEIPQNTGNIGRTCVAVGAKLWIVRPAGFRIDDARLRRAGLDYWQHLALGDAMNWEDLIEQLAPKRLFFFSRFAKRSLWDAQFRRGDTLVFGRETSGLPASIFEPNDERGLRLPTSSHVRSLNLATTVGIALYEHQRQIRGVLSNDSR